MDIHGLMGFIPLLGLTGGWRGVKIGGQPLGMGGGLGTSKDPLVQAFDKAKAEQDRASMENIARQMNELRLKENEAKAAKKQGEEKASSRPTSLFDAKLKKGDVKGALDQAIMSADQAKNLAQQTTTKLQMNQRRSQKRVSDALDRYPLL